MFEFSFLFHVFISRAPSNRCGFQNKSMKKEESSVLKGNVPDLVFFFKYIILTHHLQFSYDSEIPTAVFFCIFFKITLSTKHHIKCKF